ncbi:MAG: sugar ABC transporter permease [Spirochaetales bacterium]|jgi:putative aldouronate transport system permease protein|nr:sugar ABC transporter permease [Spirochaetales bacterium]
MKSKVAKKYKSDPALIYDFKHHKAMLSMVLIGVVAVFIFNYLPMFGIIIAFKRYNLFAGIMASPWIGFKNFQNFFNDPYFFRLVKNTVMLGFTTFLFTFPAPIVLALMLNELNDGPYKRIAQTITYLPYFVSTVVVVGLLKQIFSHSGVVNQVLELIGFEKILFFNEASWFRPLYVGSQVWQTVGYTSIIYLAALSAIDPQLYEAATIDGASRWQKIIRVTIPSIMGTIIVLMILNIGHIVSVGFEKVYLMYSPATWSTSDVLATYTYRRGIIDRDFSFGTAVGLFNSVISMIMVIGTNAWSRKFAKQSLW